MPVIRNFYASPTGSQSRTPSLSNVQATQPGAAAVNVLGNATENVATTQAGVVGVASALLSAERRWQDQQNRGYLAGANVDMQGAALEYRELFSQRLGYDAERDEDEWNSFQNTLDGVVNKYPMNESTRLAAQQSKQSVTQQISFMESIYNISQQRDAQVNNHKTLSEQVALSVQDTVYPEEYFAEAQGFFREAAENIYEGQSDSVKNAFIQDANAKMYANRITADIARQDYGEALKFLEKDYIDEYNEQYLPEDYTVISASARQNFLDQIRSKTDEERFYGLLNDYSLQLIPSDKGQKGRDYLSVINEIGSRTQLDPSSEKYISPKQAYNLRTQLNGAYSIQANQINQYRNDLIQDEQRGWAESFAAGQLTVPQITGTPYRDYYSADTYNMWLQRALQIQNATGGGSLSKDDPFVRQWYNEISYAIDNGMLTEREIHKFMPETYGEGMENLYWKIPHDLISSMHKRAIDRASSMQVNYKDVELIKIYGSDPNGKDKTRRDLVSAAIDELALQENIDIYDKNYQSLIADTAELLRKNYSNPDAVLEFTRQRITERNYGWMGKLNTSKHEVVETDFSRSLAQSINGTPQSYDARFDVYAKENGFVAPTYSGNLDIFIDAKKAAYNDVGKSYGYDPNALAVTEYAIREVVEAGVGAFHYPEDVVLRASRGVILDASADRDAVEIFANLLNVAHTNIDGLSYEQAMGLVLSEVYQLSDSQVLRAVEIYREKLDELRLYIQSLNEYNFLTDNNSVVGRRRSYGVGDLSARMREAQENEAVNNSVSGRSRGF